eukprot:PhM_4_TR9799/c4_g1_i1/m.24041
MGCMCSTTALHPKGGELHFIDAPDDTKRNKNPTHPSSSLSSSSTHTIMMGSILFGHSGSAELSQDLVSSNIQILITDHILKTPPTSPRGTAPPSPPEPLWTRFSCPLVGWSLRVPPSWTYAESNTTKKRMKKKNNNNKRTIITTTTTTILRDTSDQDVEIRVTTCDAIYNNAMTDDDEQQQQQRRTALFLAIDREVSARPGMLRAVPYEREAAVTFAMEEMRRTTTNDFVLFRVEGFCAVHPDLCRTVDVQYSGPEARFLSICSTGRLIMSTFEVNI